MHVHNLDHHIISRGPDKMVLLDHSTGEEIVSAERVPVAGRDKPGWVIGARGVLNRHASNRRIALAIMPDMAFEALGPSGPNGEGYITQTPHGLHDMP